MSGEEALSGVSSGPGAVRRQGFPRSGVYRSGGPGESQWEAEDWGTGGETRPGLGSGGRCIRSLEAGEDWKQFKRVHRDGWFRKAVETFDPEGISVLLLWPQVAKTHRQTLVYLARGEGGLVVALCKVKPAQWSLQGPLWETYVSLQVWLPDPVSSASGCVVTDTRRLLLYIFSHINTHMGSYLPFLL